MDSTGGLGEVTDGLLAFWNFNNDNSSTAIDETGNGNDGIRTGISDASTQNGTIKKGYYYDGAEANEIDVGVISLENNFTYSAWMKAETLPLDSAQGQTPDEVSLEEGVCEDNGADGYHGHGHAESLRREFGYVN